MEVRCHRCQATNPPGAAWCNQCAERFEPAAVGGPSGSPAGWAAQGGLGVGPAGPVAPFPAAPAPPGPVRPGWGDPRYVSPEDREAPPPHLGGVWPRIWARLLDALLVGVAVGVLAAVLSLPDNLSLPLTLVAMMGYETLMVAGDGQTLAKRLLRVRVVRADRAPLTPRDALVRAVVIDLLWLVPLGWPILAALLDRQRLRQGVHDRAAGTMVVSGRRSP